MEARNVTDERAEARITMTVDLEPGEGLREALVRAVEGAFFDPPAGTHDLIDLIVERVGRLFGLEPKEPAS